MRVLFVNTHYYLPQSYGGLAITLDQLCRGLAEKGHGVTVLAGFRRGGSFGWKSWFAMKINRAFGRGKTARDTGLGYPVWRSWIPANDVQYVAQAVRPDVIVIMGGKIVPVAREARKTGIPIVMQVHDVEMHFHDGDFNDVGDLPCVANSHFTAKVYREKFGVESDVIYPFISPENYKVDSTRQAVAFINPYLHKGFRLGFAIARACSDIPFLFVGHIPTHDEQGAPLVERLEDLPNVTVLAPQSDMRAVYGRTRILLAPSRWEEAYGRIVTEAQISGIPVIASTRGGLPEATGLGGILLDPSAPLEEWVGTLRKLWTDQTHYALMSERAYASSARSELDYAQQIAAHERVLLSAIKVI